MERPDLSIAISGDRLWAEDGRSWLLRDGDLVYSGVKALRDGIYRENRVEGLREISVGKDRVRIVLDWGFEGSRIEVELVGDVLRSVSVEGIEVGVEVQLDVRYSRRWLEMILGRLRLLKSSTHQGYKQFAWCVSGVGLTQASGGVIFRPHPALEVLLIADPEGGDRRRCHIYAQGRGPLRSSGEGKRIEPTGYPSALGGSSAPCRNTGSSSWTGGRP
ncbi:MAG: hypothetical protein J7J76_09480, partial [Candidatus Latescibacteria bacterium]|nr:hypothetical protein [Candidatus Latescibacterota bacterium]